METRSPSGAPPTAQPVASPVPRGGLSARIRASVTIRRLIPTGLALILVDLVYRVGLRLSPERMAYAVEGMDAVVGGTPAESDLTALAVRHVQARGRAWELQWRPWALRRIPVDGVEHLAAARAGGRGLIISFTHLGPTAGWVALGPLIAPAVLLSKDPMTNEPGPGYWGYQLKHRRTLFPGSGIERMHATGSAMAMYKLLAKGGTAMLSADWPGDRRTEFLGRPVDLADGTAALATKAGALVMPAAMLPAGRRWRIQLYAPLDPSDFAGEGELHEALAAIHTAEIRRCPEQLENPRQYWSDATRYGWFR